MTVELPVELLERSRASTGEGITGTIRRGLELVAATRAQEQLRALRGKVKFSIPVGKAKTVKLRLNKAARKELTKKGKLKLKIHTTVKLPTGKTVTSTRTLTVKKAKPAKQKRR